MKKNSRKPVRKTHKRMMDGGMATMDMPMAGNVRPMQPPRPRGGSQYDSGYEPGPAGGRGGMPPRKIVLPERPPRGPYSEAERGRTGAGRPKVIADRPQVFEGGRGRTGSGYSDGDMAARPPRTNPIGRPAGGRGGYSEGLASGMGVAGGLMGGRPMPSNPIGRPGAPSGAMQALRGVAGFGDAAVAPPSGAMDALRGAAGFGSGVAMKKGGVVKGKKMRGGGLARKGVGMALAKGGLAKRAGGCAKRGVGRGKMT